MSRRTPIRLALAMMLAVLGSLGVATPALAHGGGPDATNYLSTIISPGLAGLEWEMFGGDSLLQLTNTTDIQVVVQGYENEPYLRFTPGEGVFENIHSPATYYNDNRYANVELPPEADATADPEWRQVADGNTYAWHDHRAHWMSPVPPSPVFNDPSTDQKIFDWIIPVTIYTSPDSTHIVQVTGELWWIAPIPWWPPVLALSLAFLAVVLLAMARTRPQGAEWPGLARPVAWMVMLAVTVNVVATFDDIAAAPSPASQNIGMIATSLIAAVVIGWLCWRSRKGDAIGFAALAGAGLATFLIFAADHGAELSSSQLLTVLPEWVRRWSVAAGFAILVPVTVAVVRAGFFFRGYLKAHPVTFRRRTDPVTPPVG